MQTDVYLHVGTFPERSQLPQDAQPTEWGYMPSSTSTPSCATRTDIYQRVEDMCYTTSGPIGQTLTRSMCSACPLPLSMSAMPPLSCTARLTELSQIPTCMFHSLSMPVTPDTSKWVENPDESSQVPSLSLMMKTTQHVSLRHRTSTCSYPPVVSDLMHGTTIWGVDDPTSSFKEASRVPQKYEDVSQHHELSSLFEPIWAQHNVKKEKRKRIMRDCTIEVVGNYLRVTGKNVEREMYHDMLRATADGMTRRYKERQQAKSSMTPTSLPSDALNKETVAMTHHGSTPQTSPLPGDSLPSMEIPKWSNVTLSLPKCGLHVFNISSELKVTQP